MGERGVVPKRIDERLGHLSKAQKSGVDRVQMVGRVAVPSPRKDLHPIALRWYRALGRSGQAIYYEPSDWALALYVAEAMDRTLQPPTLLNRGFSAEIFKGVLSAAGGELLGTEAARRRARIEVERLALVPTPVEPTKITDYRDRLAEPDAPPA